MDKIKNVIKRMRWKACLFVNGNSKDNINKDVFGCETKNAPPCEDLQNLKKELFNITKIIKYEEI